MISTTQRATFDRLGVSVDDIVLVEPGTLTKTSSGKRRHRHFRDAYLRGELDGMRVSGGEGMSTASPEPSKGSPPPVFDPGSDLFVAQFDRPSDLQPVNMRALSPFHRALLVIDGTVTTFLEAYTLEPIEVVKIGQAIQELAADSPWLDLDAGARVVARQVTIRAVLRAGIRLRRFDDRHRSSTPEMVAGLDDTGAGGAVSMRPRRAVGRSCGTVGNGQPCGRPAPRGSGGDVRAHLPHHPGWRADHADQREVPHRRARPAGPR